MSFLRSQWFTIAAVVMVLCLTSPIASAEPLSNTNIIQLNDGLGSLAGPNWASFVENYGDQWTVTQDRYSKAIRQVTGSGIELDLPAEPTRQDVLAASSEFLNQHEKILRIENLTWKPVRVREVNGRWIVVFQQWHNGLPVIGAQADLRIVKGRVVSFGAVPMKGLSLDTKPALDSYDVLDLVDYNEDLGVGSARLAVLPVKEPPAYSYRLVWVVDLKGPALNQRQIIDAQTAETISTIDRIRNAALSGTVTGSVHPLYGNEAPETLPLAYAKVTVEGVGVAVTGADGAFSIEAGSGAKNVQSMLAGPFAEVFNDAGDSALFEGVGTPGTEMPIVWTNANSDPAERDAFYHVLAAHKTIKDIDPQFVELDYILPVIVNSAGSCQSNWDGTNLTFAAGGGTCSNMATFADVVYHEYGHAITDNIYLPEEPEAILVEAPEMMLEAFSDYFAATISNDPEIFEEVDSTGGMARNIDVPNLVTPDDLSGDPYQDALILSGALWDMRKNLIDTYGENLGAGVADNLFHFARYAMPLTFEEYFNELLVADDDDGNLANGTPHIYEIYQAFGQHGIGPGVGIYLSSFEIASDTNENGYAEPGETIQLQLTIYNQAAPSDDITLTLLSDNPYVTITEPVVEMPYMESWERLRTPQPFELVLDDETPLGEQIALDLLIDEGDGNYTNHQLFGLTVGTFSVLLVDDDGGDVLDAYYFLPLNNSGYSFAAWDVAALGNAPSAETLSHFDTVIWNFGSEDTDTLSENDMEALAEYLDNEGSVMFAGQGLLNDVGETDFALDYLHAYAYTEDVGATMVWGPGEDPLTAGMVIDPLIYPFTDQSDQVTPDGMSAGILFNHLQGFCALKYPMLKDQAGHRVILLTFPFEAIPEGAAEPGTPSTVMKRFLDFLNPTRIKLTDPADGDPNFGITFPVIVEFSQPIDPDSVEFVANPTPGEWSVSWSEDQKTATFSHDEPLECCGVEYMFWISAAADVDGNPLIPSKIPNPWTVLSAHPPLIDSVSPNKIKPTKDLQILVHGAGFMDEATVFIGKTELEDISWRDELTLTGVLPGKPDEGKYDVVVINPDGQSDTLKNGFKVAKDSGDDDNEGCGCSITTNSDGQSMTIQLIIGLLYWLMPISALFIIRRFKKTTEG